MATRQICYIPNGEVRLREDYGNGTTGTIYLSARLQAAYNSTSSPWSLATERNNDTLWEFSAYGSTSVTIKITSPYATGWNIDQADAFWSSQYTSVSLLAQVNFGTWKGWYDNSGGTGTALSTNLAYTLNYNDAIILDGTKNIYAVLV